MTLQDVFGRESCTALLACLGWINFTGIPTICSAATSLFVEFWTHPEIVVKFN
jgi:hypothetical protein